MGALWACAKGPWAGRAWARAPAPRLPWQCRGVSTSHGERGACPPALERGPPSLSLWPFLLLHLGLSSWGLVSNPKEAPAFLATDCPCSLLPSWPCCQRPLVPGWLCMRARASGIKRGLRDLSQAPPLACGKAGDGVRFLGVQSFHVEAPGSILCFPVLTLSWHNDLYSPIRVRPKKRAHRVTMFSVQVWRALTHPRSGPTRAASVSWRSGTIVRPTACSHTPLLSRPRLLRGSGVRPHPSRCGWCNLKAPHTWAQVPALKEGTQTPPPHPAAAATEQPQCFRGSLQRVGISG